MLEKKENTARWQRLNFWDFICLLYWSAFFVSIAVAFDLSVSLTDLFGTSTLARKFIFYISLWGSLIVLSQMAAAKFPLLKTSWRLLISPFSLARIVVGFLFHSVGLIKKIFSRIPVGTILFICLPLTILVGLTDDRPTFLLASERLAWLELLFVLFICFARTLNPLPILDYLKSLSSDPEFQRKTVLKWSTIKVPKIELGIPELLKKAHTMRGLIMALPKMNSWVNGPRLYFSFFISLCTGSYFCSVLLLTVIFRAEHLVNNNFFVDAKLPVANIDIIYFTVAKSFNISDTLLKGSIDYRWILLTPMLMAFLLTVFLILAFSLVGQPRTSEALNIVSENFMKMASDSINRLEKEKDVTVEAKSSAVEVKATVATPSTGPLTATIKTVPTDSQS